MDLSILTPAVPSRFEALQQLCGVIDYEIGSLAVEHLVLLDNKRRTVGEKRDALLRAARGKYVAFVDDDDHIAVGYVSEVLAAAARDPDVITFRQEARIDDQIAEVEFRLDNPNHAFHGIPISQLNFEPVPVVKRAAWHVCAWRRSIAIMSRFPALNYGEDWAFAKPLHLLAKTEEHIPKVLHFYCHSSTTTEAPHPAMALTG